MEKINKEGNAFDAAGMLDAFMGDEEMALPLLIRFIERTQSQLDGIPGLEKAEDWEGARREAHMIKGAAYTMGGKDLGKAAERLELAFKNMDRGEMKAAYPPVQEAFVRFKTEAEEFIRISGTRG
jgi:HPt (histidine-containing phosphotransfer) domain-containing protein